MGSVCSLPGMHMAPESPAGATAGGCLLQPVHGAPAAPATCHTPLHVLRVQVASPSPRVQPDPPSNLSSLCIQRKEKWAGVGLGEGGGGPPPRPPGLHYFTFTEEIHLFPGSFSLPSCLVCLWARLCPLPALGAVRSPPCSSVWQGRSRAAVRGVCVSGRPASPVGPSPSALPHSL